MKSALLDFFLLVLRSESAFADLSVCHLIGDNLLERVSDVAEVGIEVPVGSGLRSGLSLDVARVLLVFENVNKIISVLLVSGESGGPDVSELRLGFVARVEVVVSLGVLFRLPSVDGSEDRLDHVMASGTFNRVVSNMTVGMTEVRSGELLRV